MVAGKGSDYVFPILLGHSYLRRRKKLIFMAFNFNSMELLRTSLISFFIIELQHFLIKSIEKSHWDQPLPPQNVNRIILCSKIWPTLLPSDKYETNNRINQTNKSISSSFYIHSYSFPILISLSLSILLLLGSNNSHDDIERLLTQEPLTIYSFHVRRREGFNKLWMKYWCVWMEWCECEMWYAWVGS